MRTTAALWGVRESVVAARASISEPLRSVEWDLGRAPPPASTTDNAELSRLPFGGVAGTGPVGHAMTTVALVHGAAASGLTAVATELASVFGGSRVFFISPDRLLPLSEVRASAASSRGTRGVTCGVVLCRHAGATGRSCAASLQ